MVTLCTLAGATAFAGPLLMFLLAFYHWTQYGIHWELGPYLIPRTLLAADGEHYLDGTAVDPITLSLVRSGFEDEFMFCLLLILAVLIVLLWKAVRRMNESRRQLEYWRAKERSLRT